MGRSGIIALRGDRSTIIPPVKDEFSTIASFPDNDQCYHPGPQ